MNHLRRALQFIFVIANLVGLLIILAYIGAFENYVATDVVDEYILYVPNAFLTVMVVIIAAFTLSDSRIAFFAFLIPILPIIGCLIKGKSRWLYRILVYPVLILSLLASFIENDAGIGTLISATYLGLGVLIDILP